MYNKTDFVERDRKSLRQSSFIYGLEAILFSLLLIVPNITLS